MAKQSRATIAALSVFAAIKEFAITFISGLNLDASTFVFPVDIAGGSALPAGTNVIGTVLEGGTGLTVVNGVSGASFTSADQSGAFASVSDAPTAGQKLVIRRLIISVDTTMRVFFGLESATGTTLLTVRLLANTSLVINLIDSKFKMATADKKLQVKTSAAGNVDILASYYSEA